MPYRRCSRLSLLPLLLFGATVLAAETPEVQRGPFPAQKTGAVHTLRVIPEACAYLQGSFTTDPAKPYRFGAARTSSRCQARARLVDPAKAAPSAERGWILNDVLRVANADCPAEQAVVRVWRKPADTLPLRPDAQGRSRIYLDDSRRQAEAGKLNALPQYAAVLTIEGRRCGAAAP